MIAVASKTGPAMRAAALAVVVSLLCLAPRIANAAELSQIFAANDASSTQTINHAAWDQLLASHLSMGNEGVALFAYSNVNAGERAALKGYIETLEAVNVTSLSRDVQMAYWINLYNAVTVEVILQNFPLASIRDISSGLFSSGPWDAEMVSVQGHTLTLNDIEHEILRPIWHDPRIHYVVNCASIGCPNLAPVAYTAENLSELLERGAHDYINHSRGVRVENGRVIASRLFRWYADDFGSREELFDHFRTYADPDLRSALEGHSRIYDYEYDWSLNGGS